MPAEQQCQLQAQLAQVDPGFKGSSGPVTLFFSSSTFLSGFILKQALSTSQETKAHNLTKREILSPSSHLSKSLFGYLTLLGSHVHQGSYLGQRMIQVKDQKQEEERSQGASPLPQPLLSGSDSIPGLSCFLSRAPSA